ncbi:hypothetical protein T484DRAFT_3155132 [Baffinella frigidus]|nr:hypothetical protein T484DRAFT_3155132 [Cryptophyta sp. CCMP2293]
MATPAAAPPVDNAAAVQAPAADAARRAGGVVSTGADWFAMIPQIALMLAMYYTFATPPKPPGSRAAGAAGGAQGAVNGGSLGGSSALSGGDPAGQALSQGHPMAAPGGIPPLWPVGTEFEIYVYLTGSNETSRGVVMADDGVVPTAAAPGTAGLPDPLDIQGKGPLILYEEGLKLDSSLASNARNLEMNLTRTDIPDAWNNKTVFLHMFAARNRARESQEDGQLDFGGIVGEGQGDQRKQRNVG